MAADRTSCTKATANQFRLFLHAGAYWLMWSLCALMPKRSPWRVAQVDTLRLRLIKIAARVVELKTMIRLHLPTAYPPPCHPTGCSRTDPAAGHMTDGAHTPRIRARPNQPANLTDQTAGSEPAPAKPRRPSFTRHPIGPLEQAGSRHGELMRLATKP